MRTLPLTLALLLSTACAPGIAQPRITNLEPALQLAKAREAQPAQLYAGWRVFQQRCASCHGPAADGAGGGANLLLRMQGLGPQRFVDLALRRYDGLLGLPKGEGAAREALLDELVDRRAAPLSMPAWQGDAVVQAHVMDLYAYLAARAENRLPAGRPAR
ncbi:MAG: c-type cytochrome [Burkholderiales bacterium]|nr:c-type cytochrome [Burkholderiales bacterium]